MIKGWAPSWLPTLADEKEFLGVYMLLSDMRGWEVS